MPNLIQSLTGRRAESRSLPPPENALPLIGAYTGSTVTTATALAIGDVWAAVRVLADAASSLPIHVFRKTGDGRERVDGGFLVDLLEHPGPATSQADLVSSLMAHLAIYGNGYLAKYRSQGEIVQLGLLDPERVRPEIQGGELRFRYSPGSGPQRMLSTSDVTHVKGLSVDGVVGLSAVTQAGRILGLSDELVKHALAFFSNGARPSGVLKVSPAVDAETFEGWLSAWRESHTGQAGAHQVAVLSGDASFEAITAKLDDSQFAQQRELAAREVARVFRIPPSMLGTSSGDSLTYSTVEQESINFVRYSLSPWLRRIELAISNDPDLAFQRQFVKFEVDGLLRADAKTRSEVYTAALAAGWLDIDEVRAYEDLAPRDRPPVAPPEMVAATTNGNQQMPMEVPTNA